VRDIGIAKVLIEQGADARVVDNAGQTTLDLLMKNPFVIEKAAVCSFLVEHGAERSLQPASAFWDGDYDSEDTMLPMDTPKTAVWSMLGSASRTILTLEDPIRFDSQRCNRYHCHRFGNVTLFQSAQRLKFNAVGRGEGGPPSAKRMRY
jgi:hypothetical protein